MQQKTDSRHAVCDTHGYARVAYDGQCTRGDDNNAHVACDNLASDQRETQTKNPRRSVAVASDAVVQPTLRYGAAGGHPPPLNPRKAASEASAAASRSPQPPPQEMELGAQPPPSQANSFTRSRLGLTPVRLVVFLRGLLLRLPYSCPLQVLPWLSYSCPPVACLRFCGTVIGSRQAWRSCIVHGCMPAHGCRRCLRH
jgi:hypothetical protein